MRHISRMLLVVVTTIAIGAAFGQAETDLSIHISAQQTCVVGTLDVPCNTVGAKLLDQGIPRDAHIRLVVSTDSHYETISAALTSLRNAGFTLKVGYINAVTDTAPATTPIDSTATSTMMILQNIPLPFVDRNLAAQIGRAVIGAKYPFAVLSKNVPDITDEGDTWLVALKVVRWTPPAQLFGSIKAIPISIRKRDAAITDIFPHGAGGNSTPEAIRRQMGSDASCKRCHLNGVGPTSVK